MRLAQLTLTVRDYDEAIAFYTAKLGFELLEDTDRGGGKRWVRIAPPESPASPTSPPSPSTSSRTGILLAKAVTPEQFATVGNQTGGRVFLFLQTDDFWRDYNAMLARGVNFIRPPSAQDYGTVAVLEDLYGNKIDLIGPTQA